MMIATDLHRLVSSAIKTAKSQSVSGVERCTDIMQHLKSLRLSSKEVREFSREIHSLENLRNHENPNIRMGVHLLFNSWMKTLYSSEREKDDGRYVAHVSKNPRTTVRDIACGTRIRLHLTQKKLNVSKLTKKEDERSVKKPDIHATTQLSQNPSKSVPRPKVSGNPSCCLDQKNNTTEMLELFEIAKKSADVANAKGILAAKSETSLCVETLSLLVEFPISAICPGTRRIMERLEHLTKHRDRKICNSASLLLHHWRQSISREQRESRKDRN